MLVRQSGQAPFAIGAQPQPHDAVIVVVGDLLDQSRSESTSDEFDRAVVAEEQMSGDVADRRCLGRRGPAVAGFGAAVASDREQQLVLGRGQPD